MNYYYTVNGTDVIGPAEQKVLADLLKNGKIPDSTQVCAEGGQAWMLLSQVLGDERGIGQDSAEACFGLNCLRLKKAFIIYLSLWLSGLAMIVSVFMWPSTQALTVPGVALFLVSLAPYLYAVVLGYRVQTELHRMKIGPSPIEFVATCLIFNPFVLGWAVLGEVLTRARKWRLQQTSLR